jgi:hypothetical protein
MKLVASKSIMHRPAMIHLISHHHPRAVGDCRDIIASCFVPCFRPFLGALPLISVYDSLHGVPGIVHYLASVRFV